MKKLPIHVKIVVGLILGLFGLLYQAYWGGMNLLFDGSILLA